ERSPSCGRPSRLRALRPALIWIFKIVLAAEPEQRKTVLRKRRRLASHFRCHSRVVEHRIPRQEREEDLQQRRSVTHRSFAVRQRADEGAERLFEDRQKQRPALVLLGGQRLSQLLKGLRIVARRKMIGIVL